MKGKQLQTKDLAGLLNNLWIFNLYSSYDKYLLIFFSSNFELKYF